MGVIQIPGGLSGRTYEFTIKGDAPSATETARAQAFIQQEEDAFRQRYSERFGEELSFDDGSALGRGFDVGVTSAYGALGTAARSAGEGTGIDFLRRIGERMEGSARMEQIAEAGRMQAPTRFADVEGVGDFLTFLGEGAGQTVPEMLATMGGGLAGGAFGGPAGFLAGSTAVGTPFFAGRNIQRQEQQVAAGELPEVDRAAAFLTALPQAALNSLADKILLTGRALGLSIPTSQNLFVRVGQFGAAGAVTEVPTEISQQMLERAQAGLPLDSDDAISEYIEAGILGGVIGAGVGGGLGAFRSPEAPPAPPGAGPTPAPATPPAGPATPPVPPVTPPTPAGPSVPPVQTAPTVPPVVTAPTPGLTPQEEADIEAELQTGTPVEQTRATLRALRVPPRMEMYKRLETLGVGPEDAEVLNELDRFIPVYQRNRKLMEIDPDFPARARAYINATKAKQAAEAASAQTIALQPSPEPAQRGEAQPTAAPEAGPDRDRLGAGLPDNRGGGAGPDIDAAGAAAPAAGDAEPGPVGGAVAPTPAAPSGTETQPGALTDEEAFVELDEQAEARRAAAAPGQAETPPAAPPPPPAPPPAPSGFTSTAARGIERGMQAMAEGARAAGLKRAAELLQRGTPPTFTRPESIAAAKADPRQVVVANPDGSVTVVGVQPEENGPWVGQDPTASTAEPSTLTELDAEQSTPSAPDVPLPPAYTQESARNAIKLAAVRLGIPQTPEVLEEAAAILASKGGDPATVLSDVYMPFDAPSDPRLQGLDPFGAVADAVADAPRRKISDAAYAESVRRAQARGFRTPADVLVEADEVAARRETLAQTGGQGLPVAQGPMTGALPGQVTGAAGQTIPAGIPPEPRALTGASVAGQTQEEIAALAAADRTLRTAWEARAAGNPAQPLIAEYIVPEGALADPSTLEDRQTVRGLFLKGKKDARAKAAEAIFGKYPTVVQGLDHIAELQSRDRNLTRLIDNAATEGETLVDPETGPMDYGNALDFFEQGITANTGADASKWVTANLSREAQLYLKTRIAALKTAEKAIRKQTSAHDPVAMARKEVDQEIARTEQQYQEDFGQVATGQMSGVSRATMIAAMDVAENSKAPTLPELPTGVTATEQELATAQAGLRMPPSRMRGWTGLEIAVAQNFEGITTRKQAQAKIDELSDADIVRMIDDRATTNEFLKLFRRFKTVRQAAILDVPIPSMVRAALMNNNLQAALMHIARTAADAEVRAAARAIAANIGTTKVALVDPAGPDSPLGRDAYGAYDPNVDTVYLPNSGEITVQTLLHETGHAATAAYIDANPNSAEVSALKSLFSSAYTQVMPYLNSVPYREDGATPTPDQVTATEIKEFVTELKSNMELRNTLRSLSLDGLRIPQKGRILNALEWVNSVFRRIMRTLTRRGPGPNALQGADFLIDSIMTPQRAAGDVLFARGTRPGTGVSALMQIIRPARERAMSPSQRQKFADDVGLFMDRASGLGARTLLGFLPPLAVADIAAKVGITDPYRMFELVQRRDFLFSNAAQTVDTMLNRLQTYFKGRAGEKRAFDTIVTDSTVEEFDVSIDPTVPAVLDKNYTKFWLAYDVLDKDGNILRTERRYFDTLVDRDSAKARLNANVPATRTKARDAGNPRTPEELKILQQLKDRFNALSPEGQAMYRQLRDFYEARYDELWKVLQGDLDAILGADPRAAAEAKRSIYVKFFDKGQIRPYFPLVREGDYWLEFSAFNPATNSTEVAKTTFETPGARDRMIAALAAIPEVQKDANGKPIVTTYRVSDMTKPSFRTDALFVKNVVDIFDKYNATAPANQKISDEVMSDIAALIAKAAPESSMARQMHKRNNTPGYIEDAEVALQNKGYRLANTVARQVSGLPIRKQAQEYREALTKNPDRKQQLVLEELITFGNNALSPTNSPIEQAAQVANRIAYGYTLLGNISSFIVNLSSMGNVIFPQLGGRYGYLKASRELTRASRLFMSSGTKRIVRRDGIDTQLGALPSIDNFFIMEENGDFTVRTDIQMDAAKRQRLERMAPLLKQMSERGMLHHSLFYDTLGLQDFSNSRSISDKVYAFFGAPFHVVERMNRQASAIAGYELELARLVAENTAAGSPRPLSELQVEAANEAIYRATEMNGGASLNTAPRHTQRGLMRVAMMYKSYGITVTTLLVKTARQIVNNAFSNTPQGRADRDIAMRQMMGHLGTTFLLAGAHGLPMFGLASFIGNLLRDDEELTFDEATRLQMGELFYKGPVNALTGFEISERVGLSELLYRANRYNDDPSAEETIVQLLGGPAWSTVSGIMRGLNDMREGEYWRGFESMLPLAVSNTLRAARFYNEGGVQTRGDNFIYEDLTTSELLGRAVGFNSAELVRRQDRSSEMMRIGTGVQEKRTKLIERYFLAIRAGDDDAAARALDDILEFNDTVGGRFPGTAIDGKDIRSSFERRIDTIQDMVNGVSINPQVRDILALQYNSIQDGLTKY